MKEMIYTVHVGLAGKNARPSCKGSLYRRPIGRNSRYTICHYMIDTGEMRGCPADKCDKKVMRKRAHR